MTEKVTVTELSKYGVKVGAEYYNWSKQIKESEKGQVVPGGTYDMELYVADSGKKYINSVGGEFSTLVVTKAQPKASVTPKVTPVAKTETMSKAEWSAKDRSQLIGGLSHDAATLTASIIATMGELKTADILVIYKDFLEGMLSIRNEVK